MILSPAWQEYVDELRRCYTMIKLTAFHTRECVKAIERVNNHLEASLACMEEAIEEVDLC